MLYYLDSNAYTKSCIPQEVYLDVVRMSNEQWGNPMAQHNAGLRASKVIEYARTNILKILNAPEGAGLFFTNTVTEANLWACSILKNTNEYIATSSFEHRSIYDSLNSLNAAYQEIEDVAEKSLAFNKCYIYVQNECGLISDLKTLRKNTAHLLFSDISQAVGNMPIDLSELDLDIATFGAYKFGGPVGVGCLYLKDIANYIPFGASDNRYMLDAPGTPNTLAIYLSSIALGYRLSDLKICCNKNSSEFQTEMEFGLMDFGFDIVGYSLDRINTTTYVYVGKNANDLLLGLSEKGIIVGSGSACGSLEPKPSKLMKYFGKECMTDEFIRISQRGEYEAKDAKNILSAIIKTIKEI